MLLWALGHGFEGQDDIGSAYTCTLGTLGALPRAVEAGMVGMREGGRRRILVPPQLGWVNDKVLLAFMMCVYQRHVPQCCADWCLVAGRVH